MNVITHSTSQPVIPPSNPFSKEKLGILAANKTIQAAKQALQPLKENSHNDLQIHTFSHQKACAITPSGKRKAYYEKNKEDRRAYGRAYIDQNKEKISAQRKSNRKTQREAFFEKHKQEPVLDKKAYYQKHKERIKAYAKTSYEKKKELKQALKNSSSQDPISDKDLGNLVLYLLSEETEKDSSVVPASIPLDTDLTFDKTTQIQQETLPTPSKQTHNKKRTKSHRNSYNKVYYEKNKERIKAYAKAYREKLKQNLKSSSSSKSSMSDKELGSLVLHLLSENNPKGLNN